jgi:thiamine transporter ThiT
MKKHTRNFLLANILLALGMVLPFLTLQIKEIGDSLLPMHIPVMLCGIFCGWKYGLACGLLLPFLRSICFGMPSLYPNTIWMALELASYGSAVSMLYSGIFKKRFWCIYPSLLLSMTFGRIIWGLSKTILLGLAGNPFTFGMFLSQGFVDAIPGIILQLIFIPLFVKVEEKALKAK